MELGSGLVLSSGALTINATAQQICPRRNRRSWVTLLNNDSEVTIYVNSYSDVTVNTGMPILPGTSYTFEKYNDHIYAICSSDTANLRWIEVD